MSRIFGSVRQIGYVVQDLDVAIDRWTRLAGIGPFFRLNHLVLDHFRVGERDVDLDLSVALANSGDLQIELIHQHNPVSSPYRDFVERRGSGAQHLGVWTDAYDAELGRLAAAGHRIAAEGEVSGGARFSYFDAPYDEVTLMEVIEVTGPTLELFEHIRAAAVNWDGRDPVRMLEPDGSGDSRLS